MCSSSLLWAVFWEVQCEKLNAASLHKGGNPCHCGSHVTFNTRCVIGWSGPASGHQGVMIWVGLSSTLHDVVEGWWSYSRPGGLW